MPSGKAPIVEARPVHSMLERRRSGRRPVSTGMLSVLTVLFWGVWVYLVLPILALLLWAAGIRLFVTEMVASGRHDLVRALLSYSTVLLTLVALLLLWILWNSVRYGGDSDRRTQKRPEVEDLEVGKSFSLDFTLLSTLRTQRFLRLELDRDDCVVLLEEDLGERSQGAP
jgi:poly-beta-1,6-N-acetyl-D-glucosamine biosynthesis protein PgaD